MGALGKTVVEYAQPLIDQTDGSIEQIEKAMNIAMVCWNLAIFPDDLREESIAQVRETMKMSEEEFCAFRRDIVDPMIRRHREMFPQMAPSRPRKV